MNKNWSVLRASGRGRREYNDDYVATTQITASRRRYFVLVACDGVGSNPGSGRCAEAVARLAINHANFFLTRRGTHRALTSEDAELYAKGLESELRSLELGEQLSTTACVLIFDKDSLICAWAGDTRAYYLDVDGWLQCVTSEDHHDDEGRLTRFIDGDGHVEGGFEVAFFGLSPTTPLIALAAVTDGIHGACSFDDMKELLNFLSASHPKGETELEEIISDFLGDFVGDNYSISLYLKKLRRGLQKRLERGVASVA